MIDNAFISQIETQPVPILNTSEPSPIPVPSSVPSPAKKRNFFSKFKAKTKPSRRVAESPAAIVSPAIDSMAQIGESVARRRFQKGSAYKNKAGTLWLGSYSEYVIDKHGVEKRIRKQVTLSPVRVKDMDKGGYRIMGEREAQRKLQPYVDRVNASIASPAIERKSITFEEFAEIWKRDYLSLSKPSTQAGFRSTLKRLIATLGTKDMRAIDAGDIQRIIADRMAEGLGPKSIRNLWATVNLIWQAALDQKYVDALLPKPKLPRRKRVQPRCFRLQEIGKIIAASVGEERLFYWLAAETGLRAGEIAGLRLTDVDGESLKVDRSV